MDKPKITAKQVVVIAAAVGVGTILVKNRQIAQLEKVIRHQDVELAVLQRSLVKAGTMMQLPVFLGLVDDAITDVKFDIITKGVGKLSV